MTKKERENIAKAQELILQVRAWLTEERRNKPAEKQDEINENIEKLITAVFDLMNEERKKA